jgi:hypothetical protein
MNQQKQSFLVQSVTKFSNQQNNFLRHDFIVLFRARDISVAGGA